MWLADDRNMPLMCMKIVLPDDTPLSPWTTRPRCPGGQKAVVGIVNLPLQEGDREQSREAVPKGSDAQTGNRGARSGYGIRGHCAQPIIHLPILGMRRTRMQRTDNSTKHTIAGKSISNGVVHIPKMPSAPVPKEVLAHEDNDTRRSK